MNSNPPNVMVITPSLEAYGSDLQMLQTVAGLRDAGWGVHVVATSPGRLSERLTALGATIEYLDFPVLRRSNAAGLKLAGLAASAVRSLPRIISTIKRSRPDALYVNTVTLPWWIAAGRLARMPTVCHVHEAEARDSRAVRRALTLPLLLADLVIVNSRTTESTVTDVVPHLSRSTCLVYNGVDEPIDEPDVAAMGSPVRLVVVGRLSPRKAPDVALEAASHLRAAGRAVTLELVGTPVEGMEWFQHQLLDRANQPDLQGTVEFTGYASPIWPALARADIVLAPSLGESFGNAVVEGQLSARPVVATALQGHLETIEDESTGLLVPSEDPTALAWAVARLIDDPQLSQRLARQGRASARRNFSRSRYREEIRKVLAEAIDR